MKKKVNRLPNIKKDIKGFLLSEEGKIDKKNLAKIGLSLMILKMMLGPGAAYADHRSNYKAHTSAWSGTGHNSNAPHSSHDRHSPHDSGGWC